MLAEHTSLRWQSSQVIQRTCQGIEKEENSRTVCTKQACDFGQEKADTGTMRTQPCLSLLSVNYLLYVVAFDFIPKLQPVGSCPGGTRACIAELASPHLVSDSCVHVLLFIRRSFFSIYRAFTRIFTSFFQLQRVVKGLIYEAYYSIDTNHCNARVDGRWTLYIMMWNYFPMRE